MIVTREEAKEMWCPAARVQPGVFEGRDFTPAKTPPHNRLAESGGGPGPLTDSTHHCIADRCMWWRWAERKLRTDKLGTEGYRGYCGMAGKPE